MGWIESVKRWAKKISSNETATATVTAITNYSYQTITNTLQQVRAVPKVVNSMIHNVPTNTVVRHLLQIAREDLLPLVLVSYSNQLIQSYGKSYMEENPEDNSWMSVQTGLQTCLYLLQAATWVYQVRKQTQVMVRTTIVSLEATSLLNNPRLLPSSKVCIEENCSSLRFAQGAVRDIMTYWFTELGILCIGYLPIVGSTAPFLLVYHRGRYVLTVVLPEVCNRHQVIYLRENSELALSLGLGHLLLSELFNTSLEISTGIPRTLYASTIEQFLLIIQMSVAAHLNLPVPKKESHRTLPDPILLYQSLIGFFFDTMLLGLKVKIPRILEYRKTEGLKDLFKKIPWETIQKHFNWIHDTPTARIVLPKLLHSTENFLTDPIIAPNWKGIRLTLINILEVIEKLHHHPALRVSNFAPDTTSTLVQTIFGTPKFITRTLLKLIMDPEVITVISEWRIKLYMQDFLINDDDDDQEPEENLDSDLDYTTQQRFFRATPQQNGEGDWEFVNAKNSALSSS